jgi:hypothetical protein
MWRRLLVAVAVVALCAVSASAKDDANTRSVQGVVTAADDHTVDGAIVHLKDTRTQQIRTFVTKNGGAYNFQGLSPDIDYELKAVNGSQSSNSRTLSSFDSRKKAVMNLKLNKK